MTQDEGLAKTYLGDAYAAHAAHARKTGLLQDCPALSIDQATLLVWRTADTSRDFRIRSHAGQLTKSELRISRMLDVAVDLLPRSIAQPIDRVVSVPVDEMPGLQREYRMGRMVVWETLRSCSSSAAFRGRGNVAFIVTHRSGRVIGPYSWHPEEDEVLLPAGCRFRVGPTVEADLQRFEISLEEIL